MSDEDRRREVRRAFNNGALQGIAFCVAVLVVLYLLSFLIFD